MNSFQVTLIGVFSVAASRILVHRELQSLPLHELIRGNSIEQLGHDLTEAFQRDQPKTVDQASNIIRSALASLMAKNALGSYDTPKPGDMVSVKTDLAEKLNSLMRTSLVESHEMDSISQHEDIPAVVNIEFYMNYNTCIDGTEEEDQDEIHSPVLGEKDNLAITERAVSSVLNDITQTRSEPIESDEANQNLLNNFSGVQSHNEQLTHNIHSSFDPRRIEDNTPSEEHYWFQRILNTTTSTAPVTVAAQAQSIDGQTPVNPTHEFSNTSDESIHKAERSTISISQLEHDFEDLKRKSEEHLGSQAIIELRKPQSQSESTLKDTFLKDENRLIQKMKTLFERAGFSLISDDKSIQEQVEFPPVPKHVAFDNNLPYIESKEDGSTFSKDNVGSLTESKILEITAQDKHGESEALLVSSDKLRRRLPLVPLITTSTTTSTSTFPITTTSSSSTSTTESTSSTSTSTTTPESTTTSTTESTTTSTTESTTTSTTESTTTSTTESTTTNTTESTTLADVTSTSTTSESLESTASSTADAAGEDAVMQEQRFLRTSTSTPTTTSFEGQFFPKVMAPITSTTTVSTTTSTSQGDLGGRRWKGASENLSVKENYGFTNINSEHDKKKKNCKCVIPEIGLKLRESTLTSINEGKVSLLSEGPIPLLSFSYKGLPSEFKELAGKTTEELELTEIINKTLSSCLCVADTQLYTYGVSVEEVNNELSLTIEIMIGPGDVLPEKLAKKVEEFFTNKWHV